MLRARRWEIVAFSVTCGSLAALAAFQRWPGLNPSSLYLDDQWAASLIKAGSPGIWWEIMPQIPPRLPANHQGALPRRRPNGSVAPDPLVRMWAAAGSRDGSRCLDADRKNEPWPPGRRALRAVPGLRRVRDAREAVYARKPPDDRDHRIEHPIRPARRREGPAHPHLCGARFVDVFLHSS